MTGFGTPASGEETSGSERFYAPLIPDLIANLEDKGQVIPEPGSPPRHKRLVSVRTPPHFAPIKAMMLSTESSSF
jgi:hypothetical protein